MLAQSLSICTVTVPIYVSIAILERSEDRVGMHHSLLWEDRFFPPIHIRAVHCVLYVCILSPPPLPFTYVSPHSEDPVFGMVLYKYTWTYGTAVVCLKVRVHYVHDARTLLYVICVLCA